MDDGEIAAAACRDKSEWGGESMDVDAGMANVARDGAGSSRKVGVPGRPVSVSGPTDGLT